MSSRRGWFVVFEGLDGAGTSTQVRLLADRLRRERPDLQVAVTAEPSSGPAGAPEARLRVFGLQDKMKASRKRRAPSGPLNRPA